MRQRYLRICERLARRWGAWEIGRGISIDQDGDVDGSGILLRVEVPSWLRRWAQRQLPPPTEEEMRFRRTDISDVLLASLLPTNLTGPIKVGAEFHAPTVTWEEDRLNP
jgi:hypothetical protein